MRDDKLAFYQKSFLKGSAGPSNVVKVIRGGHGKNKIYYIKIGKSSTGTFSLSEFKTNNIVSMNSNINVIPEAKENN
jgi:hypothetical protein